MKIVCRCGFVLREGPEPATCLQRCALCSSSYGQLFEYPRREVTAEELAVADVVGVRVFEEGGVLELHLGGLQKSDVRELARRLAGWRPAAVRGQL